MKKTISVPACFLAPELNGYSAAARKAKDEFHTHGKTFLKDLAEAIGLTPGTYDIRSNKAGIAVSGEVTLHGEKVYASLHEKLSLSGGVEMLYRECNGRKDCKGGRNNFVDMKNFKEEFVQGVVIDQLQDMVA